MYRCTYCGIISLAYLYNSSTGVPAINTYHVDDHEQCVTYNEIRAEAAIQAKLRVEAFKKAAQARQKKDSEKAKEFLHEVYMCM